MVFYNLSFFYSLFENLHKYESSAIFTSIWSCCENYPRTTSHKFLTCPVSLTVKERIKSTDWEQVPSERLKYSYLPK